jgi:hypothetical protein
METYRSKDIQERLNVSKIQVSHWINMGCIKPYKTDARRGGAHEFDQRNLIEAAICKELSDLKVPVKSMALGLDIVRGVKDCHKLNDYFLIYVDPQKMPAGIPGFDMSKVMKEYPHPDFETAFFPVLVTKGDLPEMIQVLRGGTFLSLSRTIDVIGL